MNDQESAVVTPPYVPFDTFEGFLDTLRQADTVPDEIHRSQMSKMSGALQTQLIAALKFLKLIDPRGKTQDSLHSLVQTRGSEDDWRAALAAVMQPAYAPILGDFNVKTGIAKRLREKFKETSGLDGTTLDRAIRFYLKGLKASGVEVSPYLFTRKSGQKRAGSNGRSKQETPPEPPAAASPHATGDFHRHQPPEGTISIPIYFPNKPPGEIIVPANLKDGDLPLVETALAMVKAYAKANTQPGAGERVVPPS